MLTPIYNKILNFYKCLKVNDSYFVMLDSYYYDFKKKSYVLTFRLRNKSIGQTIIVKDVFFDKNLLKELHPIDAYKVGIIFGMPRNNILHRQLGYISLKSPYHKNRIKIKPTFPLKNIPLIDNYSYIVLRLVSTDYEFTINLNEFQNKQFLLYGLHPVSAAKVGLIISEHFINKFNFNS